MARRCFEVKNINITIWFSKIIRTEEIPKSVEDKLRQSIKKYASNTKYELSSKNGYNYDAFTIINVKFSKKGISVNTANNIFTQLFLDESDYDGFTYNSNKEQINIIIVK